MLLELKGENPFKIRAYDNAARALSTLEGDFETLVRTGELAKIKGFGKALVQKLSELAESGKLEFLEKLRQEFPDSLPDLLGLGSIGPKKVKLFYEKLNISNIPELEAACEDGRIASLPGLGIKSAQKILLSIKRAREYDSFFLFRKARLAAEAILRELTTFSDIQRVELAGSVRRFKEYTKDADIIASTDKPEIVMDQFVKLTQVREILAKGATKSSVIWSNGIQVDLRVVPDDIFPFALHHFTGSKEHNIGMRSRAIRLGLKVSEWGLFRTSPDHDDVAIPCESEADFFSKQGLHYIPPELRENRGEIEYAEKAEFPELVEFQDYKGVLHCHSYASDGSNSISELVQVAQNLGHNFLGITDHSKASFQANGLDEERLLEQNQMIKDLQRELDREFVLFSGIECDIMVDGRLDLSDDVLKELDFVVISVHSGFSRNRKEMTKRVVRAIEHPATNILAHPTGRLLLKRDAYEIDLEQIIDAAKENHVAIELNCNPMRMDMEWKYWKKAKDKGVLCSLNPDAHAKDHFDFIKDGIGFCRKGWLEKEDIINCWSTEKLARFFKKERHSKSCKG